LAIPPEGVGRPSRSLAAISDFVTATGTVGSKRTSKARRPKKGGNSLADQRRSHYRQKHFAIRSKKYLNFYFLLP